MSELGAEGAIHAANATLGDDRNGTFGDLSPRVNALQQASLKKIYFRQILFDLFCRHVQINS